MMKAPADDQEVLRFYLLGSPKITWKGTPLIIQRRSVRAILYRLACDPEPVSRCELHLLFWPDVPETAARRNLTHHLTHIRQALPAANALIASGNRIWLDPNSIWCDALELKRAAREPPVDVSGLQAIAESYHGSFLKDFDLARCGEFGHWFIVERTALERQYLRVLKHLVDFFTAHGETNLAVKYARDYLETDPLSETMHQRLIQLYAGRGDRHMALQQYEACASILDRELGVRPLAETLATYEAVLYGMDRFPDPASAQQKTQLPNHEVPFINREAELQMLANVFHETGMNRGRVVLIYGEAGIGKSRLMRTFAERQSCRAWVLSGAGYDGEQAIPYRPLMDALRAVLGFGNPVGEAGPGLNPQIRSVVERIDPIWLSEVARLIPELPGHFPGLSLPLSLEPDSVRTRLFDALTHFLCAFATSQNPVLICLDNLQWIDNATRAWLVHVGRMLAKDSYPIMILGAYRSEDCEKILDLHHALTQAGVLTELELSGPGNFSYL